MHEFLLQIKSNENRHTFADIMKFYRNQPQADSHIYRSVFIEYLQSDKEKSDDKDQAGSNKNGSAVEPDVVSGRNTVYGTESRGDIIYFYNKIFVPKMQNFAMRFSTSSSQVSSFEMNHINDSYNFLFLLLLFFSINPEQFVAFALATCTPIDLTQKNLAVP